MASIFDGLAGALNAVFGAPVTITRRGEAAVTLQAVFRELPVEQDGADGRPFVTITPTLRVQKDAIAALVRGDLVAPSTASGRSFVVLQPYFGASPASDAFLTYVLEECRS